jgi:hypothetical protein
LGKIKMNIFEPPMGAGCENECMWKVSIVAAGSEESGDGLGLDGLELLLLDVCGAERIP